MLGWFADAPNPDAGLLGFRQISEALGSTHWYLQTLRDEGQVAQRLATVLASSRYATDLLLRAPDGVRMLATDEALEPLCRATLQKEMTAAARRHTDPVEAVTAVRAVRRRELFRIAVADLLGLVDVDAVGDALTDVTAATLEAALTAAVPGDRGGAPGAAADPDRDRGDGPVRRVRAGLRQRRRRVVRARAAAGRDRRGQPPGRP